VKERRGADFESLLADFGLKKWLQKRGSDRVHALKDTKFCKLSIIQQISHSESQGAYRPRLWNFTPDHHSYWRAEHTPNLWGEYKGNDM